MLDPREQKMRGMMHLVPAKDRTLELHQTFSGQRSNRCQANGVYFFWNPRLRDLYSINA